MVAVDVALPVVLMSVDSIVTVETPADEGIRCRRGSDGDNRDGPWDAVV